MSYKSEFETVNLLIESDKETRGVDAFSLALIKTEKQMRKLFTHLIYQYPNIQRESFKSIRSVLFNNRRVYFEGFIIGFNTIYPIKIDKLIGEDYEELRGKVDEAIEVRNKIFHGQLTDRYMSRADLINLTDNLSNWCKRLSESAKVEIGYDGFEWNSLKKSKLDLHSKFLVKIDSLKTYEEFVAQKMAR